MHLYIHAYGSLWFVHSIGCNIKTPSQQTINFPYACTFKRTCNRLYSIICHFKLINKARVFHQEIILSCAIYCAMVFTMGSTPYLPTIIIPDENYEKKIFPTEHTYHTGHGTSPSPSPTGLAAYLNKAD